ncbi:hypothetical protein FGG08_006057 [Glutinoglossum americanum]|uniref:Uncharacterized protein n=1 Tax=Glutinoglossum americanum TaxID=1670608 RepID=A0A9P8HX59_9PEZI|nr:hypothetical protein FGG08_006057 [Glutinoglossum americanum]
MTQDDVNEALEEYNTKQKELTKIAARKKKKREEETRKRSKGKRVVREVTVLSTALVASGVRSEAQVLDSKENIGLRAILISSDISDSEAFETSEPYIQRLRKVLVAGPSRGASNAGMVTRSRARKEN